MKPRAPAASAASGVPARLRPHLPRVTAFLIVFSVGYSLGILSSSTRPSTPKPSQTVIRPHAAHLTAASSSVTASSNGTGYPRSPPHDLFRFGDECGEPVPAEDVVKTLLDKLFDGESPYASFPPEHTAKLLHPAAARPRGWGSTGAVFADLIEEVRPDVIVELGFCGSWGHYTCLSWLPTFFSEELNLNLTDAAWVSILPPLGSMVITSIAAPFADNLISSGVDTTKVRKICQAIAFLSPAAFMMLSSVDLGLPPWVVVAFLTSGISLSNFALSGLYCTHQDISREYASILLGITNTIGAVPGIVGVALVGYLVDTTHSWSMSLFAPSIFFYLTGTAVWLTFASSKPQDFNKSASESITESNQ